MKRVGSLLVVASLVGIAAVVGCTSTIPDEPIYSLMGTDPAAADGGDSNSTSIKLSGDDDDDNTSSSSTGGAINWLDAGPKKDGGSSTSSTSSSSSSSGGSSTSSSSSSSGGTSSGGAIDPCKDTTCGTAIAEASMSGDTGSATKSITGATSRWFTVRVTEDYHSIIFGQPLTFKATLSSPPGANFDLFVYRPDGDVKECSSVRAKSENTTGDDSVRISWGEGSDPNGSDDARTVTVEVREISPATTCDPTATWTLKLQSDVP